GPTLFIYGGVNEVGAAMLLGPLVLIIAVVCLFGFMAVAPNDARVLLLFGEYRGSVKESGVYWVNPFFTKRKVSLRVRNFETGGERVEEHKDASGHVVKPQGRSTGRPSKVNDRDGN